MSIKILTDNIKSGSFGPLYYIYGEEEYLKTYYFNSLKDKAMPDLPEFNLIEFDSKSFDYDDFCNSVNSYPVMAEKKLVTVTDFDNSLLKKEFNKDFVAFLKDIPDYCTVVFFDTYLKAASSSNPLLKVLGVCDCVAVDVKKLDTTALVNWMLKQFKAKNKQIDKQDVYYILDLADDDMFTLSNEIVKLCSYVQGDTVTRADIDLLVTKSIETNRFEIGNAFVIAIIKRF